MSSQDDLLLKLIEHFSKDMDSARLVPMENKNSQAIPEEGPKRRIFARIPLKTRIEVNLEDAEEIKNAFSHDLSGGGMFVKTDRQIEIGTDFEFCIKTGSDRNNICGLGRVVRVVEPDPSTPLQIGGWGIKFVSLDEESIETLRQLLLEIDQG